MAAGFMETKAIRFPSSFAFRNRWSVETARHKKLPSSAPHAPPPSRGPGRICPVTWREKNSDLSRMSMGKIEKFQGFVGKLRKIVLFWASVGVQTNLQSTREKAGLFECTFSFSACLARISLSCSCTAQLEVTQTNGNQLNVRGSMVHVIATTNRSTLEYPKKLKKMKHEPRTCCRAKRTK